MAVGFPVKDDYATGDVLTAANMNDLSGTLNTVNAPLGSAAGKNRIINGATNIWQRGTTFTVTGTSTFTADRYLSYRSGAAAGMTVTRSTDAPTGFQYSAKIQRDSGNSGVQNMNFRYAMETSDAIRLAGQTVTISFYAKAGANYSSASSNLNTFQYSGTGTDQAPIDMTIWTGLANTSGTTFTLTTSWQRFTVTQSYASTVKQIGLAFVSTPVGTAGADDSFFITGIQVEAGSIATPFQTATGTIQGELAAAQRYYQSVRTVVGTAAAWTPVPFTVTMRVDPTVAGGGAGFANDDPEPNVGNFYQTARAYQTLTLSAEL
jgi:hypothetical protein